MRLTIGQLVKPATKGEQPTQLQDKHLPFSGNSDLNISITRARIARCSMPAPGSLAVMLWLRGLAVLEEVVLMLLILKEEAGPHLYLVIIVVSVLFPLDVQSVLTRLCLT